MSCKQLSFWGLHGCALFALLFSLAWTANSLAWTQGVGLVGWMFPNLAPTLLLRALFSLLGILMFTASLFSLLNFRLPEEETLEIIRETAGSVSITPSAIEEFLEREGARQAGVNHLKVRMNPNGGKPVFNVDAYVTAQFPLPHLSNELRKFMDSQLRHVIGIEDCQEIQIIFKHISQDTRPLLLSALNDRDTEESQTNERENSGNSAA